MRVGVFGGSFDPVHFGHLFLAEYCREACELDEVLFIPAGQPPHKSGQRLTPPEHRLEMLRLAIANNPGFSISDVEIKRDGPSYTVDTLAELKEQRPDANLFLLMGADMLADFPTWREPTRICELASLAVVARADQAALDWSVMDGVTTADRQAEFISVKMPRMDISSTEIRERVFAGMSIRYRTPDAVMDYIHATPAVFQRQREANG